MASRMDRYNESKSNITRSAKHQNMYNSISSSNYLNYEKLDAPLGVQLFGSDVDNLVKAAKIVKEKAPFVDFIDINMACPVNKVIKTGAGSSLLKDPKKCGEIVRRIREETSLPVSAKIRLGISDKNTFKK